MENLLINIYKKSFSLAHIKNDILCNFESYNFILLKKFNIYKGKITKIQFSLEAVFVNYGEKKDGFLPFKNISENYFLNNKININSSNIKYQIKINQNIIVQIIKEGTKKKGAKLTTFIFLLGNYLILLPNNKKNIGISKKIKKLDKIYIKKNISQLYLPDNMNIIIRTLAGGKKILELKKDLLILLNQWNTIKKISKKSFKPILLYQENSTLIKILQYYLNRDIKKIFINDFNSFNLIYFYLINLSRFDYCQKMKLYTHSIPIFMYYNIEYQIKLLSKRKIILPSGGSLIIDFTEALTVIDVNSCKFINGKNIENTAFKINLEAIYEIGKQLRLRDIGGLIIIDFINMKNLNNKKKIEKKIKKIFFQDRANIETESISKFGILELSRQKLNSTVSKII